MTSDVKAARVVPAASLRGQRRLGRIADLRDRLTCLSWSLVARSDDGLSVVLSASLTAQPVETVWGVSVTETDDAVTVAILVTLSDSDHDRMAHSLTATYVVDLPSPLGRRLLIDPSHE